MAAQRGAERSPLSEVANPLRHSINTPPSVTSHHAPLRPGPSPPEAQVCLASSPARKPCWQTLRSPLCHKVCWVMARNFLAYTPKKAVLYCAYCQTNKITTVCSVPVAASTTSEKHVAQVLPVHLTRKRRLVQPVPPTLPPTQHFTRRALPLVPGERSEGAHTP